MNKTLDNKILDILCETQTDDGWERTIELFISLIDQATKEAIEAERKTRAEEIMEASRLATMLERKNIEDIRFEEYKRGMEAQKIIMQEAVKGNG